MQLSQSLNIKQKQSLVMTPQLQQAIRLLQMTNLDLRQYLETECFENPFLEVGSIEDSNEPIKSDTDQTIDSENNQKKENDDINKKGIDAFKCDVCGLWSTKCSSACC